MPIAKHIGAIRTAIIYLMGGRCVDCSATEQLEFSHQQPTGLSGESRGSTRRIVDVCRNIQAYRLRCKRCHTLFDGKQVKGQSACRYHQMPIEQCLCSPLVQ